MCGSCGANLPLVYGSDGKPRIVTDDPYRFSTITGQARGGGFLSSPSVRGGSVRWMMRGLILLSAVLGALWILSRR